MRLPSALHELAAVLLYLREDVAAALRSGQRASPSASATDAAIFDRLWQLPGETYRRTANRRTLRVTLCGKDYFAKLHNGVGWGEILKNLLQLKWPILGASHEYAACRHLASTGVWAPRVAAYGRRGWNPAAQRSFVLCEALAECASLEDVVRGWGLSPPPLALRRQLLRQVAVLTRNLHGAGVNHRDYYLCHLFVDTRRLAQGEVALAVIDLHRAGIRGRVPRRWLLRDLAALLYSAHAALLGSSGGLRLSQADLFRFVRDYAGAGPAAVIRRDRRFWRAVERRATRLQHRGHRDTAALPPDAPVPAVDAAPLGTP